MLKVLRPRGFQMSLYGIIREWDCVVIVTGTGQDSATFKVKCKGWWIDWLHMVLRHQNIRLTGKTIVCLVLRQRNIWLIRTYRRCVGCHRIRICSFDVISEKSFASLYHRQPLFSFLISTFSPCFLLWCTCLFVRQ